MYINSLSLHHLKVVAFSMSPTDFLTTLPISPDTSRLLLATQSVIHSSIHSLQNHFNNPSDPALTGLLLEQLKELEQVDDFINETRSFLPQPITN